MFKELKFVQGAVAKKDFVPAITHFAIREGTVRAYNGTIALCSPINCDLDCQPKAIPMVQAIGRCKEAISLHITPAGRLSIKSGKYRTLVDCVTEPQAIQYPEGEPVYFHGRELLDALEAVEPFIGNDASRPWGTGVLIRGESVFATNNVCLVEYWVGKKFPHVVNLPRAAVQEMLRIGDSPTHCSVSENSITFFYDEHRWLKSQLYSTEWPDLAGVLDRNCNPVPVNEEIFTGLELIKPFANKMGQVFLNPGLMHTHLDIEEGSSYELDWNGPPSVYSIEMLSLLAGVAKTADFTEFPQPCHFFDGKRMRGAIIGMRLPEKPEGAVDA